MHYLKELYGHKLTASDGDIGEVKDFCFDDRTWAIRYLVADTGRWLTGRLLLLSPHSFGKLDHYENTLYVKLHKKQIESSPVLEPPQPVSRQYEIECCRYFGWPAYWESGSIGKVRSNPANIPPQRNEGPVQPLLRRDDTPLQSTQGVTGYRIQTTDGEIGSVSGFKVDDRSWMIRELVVEAGHWYLGKEILIPTTRISRINGEDSSVSVALTKADIQRTAENHVVQAGTGNHGTEMFRA